MSDYERCKGVLVEVKNDKNLSVEELCKEVCNTNSIEMKSYHDSWTECLLDIEYGVYIVLNGKLFEIQNYKDLNIYEDYCRIRKLKDGSYAFEAQFYNGGTCLSEMLENHFDEVQE